MMNIPIGITGRIRNGEHADMHVRVEDDAASTGGYLVFQWWKDSDGPNPNGAFDDWVESIEQLDTYFGSTEWIIDWETSTTQ